MLPQDGHENEDGRDEDEGERNLRYGPRGERLDVDFGARLAVLLLVPPGEGGQQDEAEESEDDGDDEEVREHNGVLERRRDPHEVERVLVYRHALHERRRVVRADIVAAVFVDADPEVADAHGELRVADDVPDGLRDARVDLLGGVGRRVLFVPHGDEEDARYQRGGGGAACEE